MWRGSPMGRWMVRVGIALGVVIVVGIGLCLSKPSLLDWVYREASYQVWLDTFLEDEGEPLLIAERVMHQVHQQVYPDGGVPFDADSWTTLVRGIGWCDQKAWAVGTLLSLKGIDGRLVILLGDFDQTIQTEASHTMLEISIDGKWHLIDPLYDLVFRMPDGSPATISDVSEQRDALASNRIFRTLTSEGRQVVLELYEKVLIPLRTPPAFWPSVHAQRQAESLKFKVASVIHRIWARLGTRWAYAFQDVYLAWFHPKTGLPDPREDYAVFSTQKLSASDNARALRLYEHARNYHLYGRLARAEASYRDLIASYPHTLYAAQSQHWIARIEVRQGRGQDAIETLTEFFAVAGRKSHWASRANATSAEAYALLRHLQQSNEQWELSLSDPTNSVPAPTQYPHVIMNRDEPS